MDTNKKKYVVVLEVESDTDPSTWNYNYLLSSRDKTVSAEVLVAYENCCESYANWAKTHEDDRWLGNTPNTEFYAWQHDDTCAHYESDDEDSPAEVEAMDIHELFNRAFGVHKEPANLTVLPKADSLKE
jgi:hypothetical protein